MARLITIFVEDVVRKFVSEFGTSALDGAIEALDY